MVGLISFCVVAGSLQHFVRAKTEAQAVVEASPVVRRVVKAGQKWESGDMRPYVQSKKVIRLKSSPVSDYSVSVKTQRQQALLSAVKKRSGRKVSIPEGFDFYEARVQTEHLLYSQAACNGTNALSDVERKNLVDIGAIAM
jgi:hypothetical protein